MSFRRSMKISSKKEPGFTINHICEIPEDNVNLNFYIGSEATLNLSSNWQPSMQKKNAVKQLCLNCQSLSLEAKSSVESSRPNIDKYFEKLKRSRSIKSGSDVGLNKTRLNFQHDIALDDLSVGNRQYLRNMIKSMLFLAKQGIILAENESNQNHNLFFEFVKFKLNESSSQYCDMNLFNSKVQTDLYQILNDQVLQLIVKEIDDQPYSIILNETTDVARGEKIAFIVRYLSADGDVKERLLSLDSTSSLKDASLKVFILEKLKALNLSCDKLVGHSYEGSQHINWIYNDVILKIKSDLIRSSYVQYSVYNLNVVLLNSCSTFPEVRDCLAAVNSLFNFVENSCKSRSMFKKRTKCLKETHEKLVNLSRNHYVSRTEIISVVKETLGIVLDCLKSVDCSDKSSYGAKAKFLLNNVNNFEFIFIIHMLDEILNQTSELSDALQEIELDFIYSRNLIKNTIKNLQELRNDSKFEDLIHECCAFAIKNYITVPLSKRLTIVSGQENAHSRTKQNQEQNYHSLFFNLIDSVVDEIKLKFQDLHVLPIVWTAEIIRNVDEMAMESLKDHGIYNGLIDFVKLKNELICWKLIKKESSLLNCCERIRSAKLEHFSLKLKSEQKHFKQIQKKERSKMQPYTIHEMYEGFKQLQLKTSLPQLDLVFRIYLSIPVTSVNLDQSLSVLKRIKNWHRSTIGHKRPLQNMTLLNIESDLLEFINIEKALVDFINNSLKKI